MKHHLNTLFVTTDGAYLRKEGQSVVVTVEKEAKLRVPVHMLGSICCFGRISMSPQLMGHCAESGVAISFLTEYGKLLARVTGFTSGNVLLRRQQYRVADDIDASNEHEPAASLIVQPIVIAKLLNCRNVLLRDLRDRADSNDREAIRKAAAGLLASVQQAEVTKGIDQLRGIEGEAARLYFSAVRYLFTRAGEQWKFTGRNRRPPRDNVNALLSFIYTLLVHDARSACEATGLDPQVGFLHRDRPGRPSLALDLMEEFRAFLADRLVLSLINRQQVKPGGFKKTETGGIIMNDATRKVVLNAYQKRKQDEIIHPFLNEKVSVGLLVHLQARLLARHLRGDLDAYPPFIWR